MIAYVAGHTHENQVLACGSANGCTAARTGGRSTPSRDRDWPQQSRLIEVMDNRDGTLSIFGTLTTTAAPVGVPAPGTRPRASAPTQLASISRAFTFNDPQLGDGTGRARRGTTTSSCWWTTRAGPRSAGPRATT